jgi:hypothetical protein
MRLWLLLAGLLLAPSLSPAVAADAGIWRKPAVASPAAVYRVIPRSAEASLVWASNACWRGCAQDCGRHLQTCLQVDTQQGSCLSRNDTCDRFCQRECRLYGGPLLPFD